MSPLRRTLKELMKQGMHVGFVAGQRLGWDILPRHFYSGIPDISELNRSDCWRTPCSMIGVGGAGIDEQVRFLQDCCPPSIRDRMTSGSIYAAACAQNGEPGYGPIEADFLHAFVHRHRPARVVQVGAGVSTAVILAAAKEAGRQIRITCVDPYPTPFLRRLAAEGQIGLVVERAQAPELDLFLALGAGDLFFVDSTHAVKAGSEVNRIILEILPRLPKDCYVHFHDIYFPFDFAPSILRSVFFPAESTLLHAYLTDNRRYAISLSLSMLHHARPEVLAKALPNYRPARMDRGIYLTGAHLRASFPSSTYLRVTA